MSERVEVLIVGGGPGGLACAADLAAGGVRVLLVERKAKIGAKVCAGGITWNGLIRLVPETLIEAAFPEQHIVTGRQRTVVAEANPIVATVNRERLGQWMAQRAAAAGADLRTGCRVLRLDSGSATLEDGAGRQTRVTFDCLVGADGSNSLVRRWLGLPVRAVGLGLNAILPRRHARMEWHLRADLFGRPFSEGSLFTANTICYEALESAEQEIKRQLLNSPVINCDETGARADGARQRTTGEHA